MADNSQPYATAALRSVGFWTLKTRDAINMGGRMLKPEEPGRADIIVGYGSRLVFVEVKNDKHSLAFGKETGWKEEQREWAVRQKEVFGTETWLFIELGTGNRGSKVDPKRAWLVPADVMLGIIELVAPQKSLPYCVKPGMARHIQDNKLDAVTLLANYELYWKDARYQFHPDHNFVLTYRPSMRDVRDLWKPKRKSQ